MVPDGFGASLSRERRARRWTQARLAARAGLDRATVVRLEAGRRRPVPDTVFRLEAALFLCPRTLVPGWPEWSPIGRSTYGGMSRERRRELGLSLGEVAAAAGVSAATLSRFEREVGRSSLVEAVPLPSGGVAALPREALSLALGFADRRAHADYCSPR
jgi:transcriptional regulator with XRE-family HTH domain